jgi:serine protease AprX
MRNRPVILLATSLATSLTALAVGVPAATPLSAPIQESMGVPSSAWADSGSRYIVRVEPDAVPAVIAAVRSGGAVVAVQEALNTLVVEVDPVTAERLSFLPGVVDVSPDSAVHPQSLGFTPSTQPGSMTNITRITGASAAWTKGYTGSGVDVALIDTGVAPVPALKDSAKVVVGPDLSFESQDRDLIHLDSYGHGTHMAGIIAGREVARGTGANYARDTTNFYGMAPDARLVSLKIADNQGAVDVSQMIAAVNWVVQNKNTNGMNIRVLNLSYGSASPQDPRMDPLSWAAEVAWRNGIVVVASVGNEGDNVPGLSNPAYNPWVIAVGAVDTRGTDARTDDVVPSFSARAGGNWGTRGPDLVAPGVSVISCGVPGGNIFATYSAARIGNNFLKGSGTSQATAVVSGAVADLLQARPSLTPDQVKALLRSTATPLAGQTVAAQGAGELNLATALTAAVPATQNQTTGNGGGSLESARGGFHVSLDGQQLNGEIDIMGHSWSGAQLAVAMGQRTIWGADGLYNGTLWTGGGFVSDTTTWAGRTWQGRTWQGRTWQGAWSGRTWQGRTWLAKTWTGSAWTSGSWSSSVGSTTWNSQIWAGAGWK